MTTQDMKYIVKSQPFFEDITDQHLDVIVRCASNITFKKGHFILTAGEPANTFYIIKCGRVAVEIDAGDKGPINIQTLEGGDILGWSWLIPPYKWQFDALALESTSVLLFDGACLRQEFESNYELGFDVVKRITAVITYRLMNTRMKLMDFYV